MNPERFISGRVSLFCNTKYYKEKEELLNSVITCGVSSSAKSHRHSVTSDSTLTVLNRTSPVGLLGPVVGTGTGDERTNVTIAKEDVTKFVMVRRGVAARSRTAIKDDTRVRSGGVGIHSREVMIGKSETIQRSVTSSCGRRIFEGACRNTRGISCCFLGGGRTDIHLHISQNAIENQRLKSLGRSRCNIACSCRGFTTKRQNDIIREVGVKLESETDLLLIGRAGDSAGFFTG